MTVRFFSVASSFAQCERTCTWQTMFLMYDPDLFLDEAEQILFANYCVSSSYLRFLGELKHTENMYLIYQNSLMIENDRHLSKTL